MRRSRQDIKGKKIFASIDETSDVDGRYIANVIVGTLGSDISINYQSFGSCQSFDDLLTVRSFHASAMARGSSTQ